MSTTLLEMRNITKTFPGVVALNDVSFRVAAGEIHCLVGENGAGKSTLMKVLSGVHPHGEYTGEIVFDGKPQSFHGIADSEKAGIAIIYQELALVPEMTVYDNIFLGHEIRAGLAVDLNETIKRAGEMLRRVRLDVSPEAKVRDLGVGKQQLVEIAKALSMEVRLLILDEPTASLNEKDSDALLELLLGLKAQGITCILISHKLHEIAKVADAITVLRDGATVATLDCRAGPVSEDLIIKHMVGREMVDRYPRRSPRIGETVFELQDWRVHHPIHTDREVVKGVSLKVGCGEIVGIAGLMGAGRTELAMSVFGRSWGRRISGRALLHGKEVDLRSVEKATAHGLAYVTEDRKSLGLVLNDSIAHNTTLAHLGGVSRRGVIDEGREVAVASDYRTRLATRCASVHQAVVNLSGGNQQKVVLAKWLDADPSVLILDEPTRGIDVGAKYEIYTLTARLADEGKAIILISSEMPELLGMCDRIYVMTDGRFVGEFTKAEATQEQIMRTIVRASARTGT